MLVEFSKMVVLLVQVTLLINPNFVQNLFSSYQG